MLRHTPNPNVLASLSNWDWSEENVVPSRALSPSSEGLTTRKPTSTCLRGILRNMSRISTGATMLPSAPPREPPHVAFKRAFSHLPDCKDGMEAFTMKNHQQHVKHAHIRARITLTENSILSLPHTNPPKHKCIHFSMDTRKQINTQHATTRKKCMSSISFSFSLSLSLSLLLFLPFLLPPPFPIPYAHAWRHTHNIRSPVMEHHQDPGHTMLVTNWSLFPETCIPDPLQKGDHIHPPARGLPPPRGVMNPQTENKHK